MRNWHSLAPLPLRIILGMGMMFHGYSKLFSAEGHQGFVGMLTQIGIPASGIMSWLVGILEFFGGLALVLGAFVSIVSVLLIIDMLVAAFMIHLPSGFNFMNITGMTADGPTFGMPGYEVSFVYIAGFLALMLGGAGAYSVDDARAGGAAANPLPGTARTAA